MAKIPPKILIGPSHINSVGGKFQSILENAGYERRTSSERNQGI